MFIRLFSRLALAMAAFSLCVPAIAANNYVVKDGNGATITKCSQQQGDSSQADCAALLAGDLHIGEVGNNVNALTATPTVTASAAYAAGNSVGGLITFAGATRVGGSVGASGTSGSIQSLIMSSKSSQGALSDVIIFNASPTSSTCTDKTAFSLAAADIGKIVGVVHMTDWVSMGTASMGQAQNQAMPYALSSSTTLYACVVTRGTPTFTSTSDIAIALNVFRN